MKKINIRKLILSIAPGLRNGHIELWKSINIFSTHWLKDLPDFTKHSKLIRKYSLNIGIKRSCVPNTRCGPLSRQSPAQSGVWELVLRESSLG